MFWIGVLVGAVIVALIPPEYEDRLRVGIINTWKNFTKKG